MENTLVNYELHKRIAYITLNRPEKRNALNTELVTQLQQALDKAETDTEAKVIVIKAEGKAFCAGADLAYLQQLQQNTYEENLHDSSQLKKLFYSIYNHKKIVIAQVHGHAIAGGCGLATVCDFVFCADHIKLGYTEVKIGFIPALVLVFLVRKIGEGKAKQLLLSGNLITAQTAKEMGLINEVCQLDELHSKVQEFAEKLCIENSGQSMELTKKLINSIQHLPIEEALQTAATSNAKARNTADCKKGISAFLNKEKIQW